MYRDKSSRYCFSISCLNRQEKINMEMKIASFSEESRDQIPLMLPRIVLLDIPGYFGKKKIYYSRFVRTYKLVDRKPRSGIPANPHDICTFKSYCIDDLWRTSQKWENLYDWLNALNVKISFAKLRLIFLKTSIRVSIILWLFVVKTNKNHNSDRIQIFSIHWFFS